MLTVLFDCPVCGTEREAKVQFCANAKCEPPCERLECLVCGTNVAVEFFEK